MQVIKSSYDFMRMEYQAGQFVLDIIDHYPSGINFAYFTLSDQTFVYLMNLVVTVFTNIVPIMDM